MIVSEYIIFWRNVSAGTVLISFSCLAVIFDKPWVEFIICCLYLLVAAQVDEGLNWVRQRGQSMWLDKLVPVFLDKHVFPGGTCVYKSLSIFRQIPFFINQHKTHVFSRTNEIWFFICALGATCKIFLIS